MDGESEKYRVNVDTVEGYDNQLDVISFSLRGEGRKTRKGILQ